MIPMMNIIAWSASAPWAEIRQVEQDLIISRALIELFGDPMLAQELRFRGGTALHKLHSPEAAALFRRHRPCSHHSRANRPNPESLPRKA